MTDSVVVQNPCIHLPEYLRHWDTVYPFLCHGVEGRHRFFKLDLHLSTGSQWNRQLSAVGFAGVLSLDTISWGLRSYADHTVCY